MPYHFRNFFILLIATFFVTCSIAMANTVNQITLPVTADQQEETILKDGLAKVLIRLTGNPEIINDPNSAEFLKNPRDYLDSYKQNPDASEVLMVFNKAQIEKELTLLNIPSWGMTEPTIITWWLQESGQAINLIDDSQEQTKDIAEAANQQGIITRFPIADLDEQALANKAIFTENSSEELRKASLKYGGNAILVINAIEQPQKSILQWRLWTNNTEKEPFAQGNIEANNIRTASEQLFASINPALAKVYLVKSENPQQLSITVKNIDFNGYVQVSKVMALFDGKLIETSGSVVHYQVTADPRQIKAQMNLINLQEETSTENTENHLTFKP